MAATILARGDTLGGYKIEDIIGVGGMAIVYQAEQLSLGRQVALKVIAPQLSANPGFRERFRREGKHIAGLDHPNVVTVFDSGEIDGRLFLAMRLVDGTTLADRMHGEGISADETIAMLAPIAGALDTAHGLGLVHRDVKPQNILITEGGHPYLADFGVAKAPSSTAGLTNTGAFVGSVNYASPEQIRGEQVSSAGDIYALTAVLYQCLTGQVPFPRDTDAGVMHAHLHEPPPRLPIAGDHGEQLDRVIQRGMAKEWAERYATATEVTTDAGSVIRQLEPGRRLIRPAFGVSVDASQVGTATSSGVGAPDVPAGTTVAPSVVPLNREDVAVAASNRTAAGLDHTETPLEAPMPVEAAALLEAARPAVAAVEAEVTEAREATKPPGDVADGTEIIDPVSEPVGPRVGEPTSADVRRPEAPEPPPSQARRRRKLPVMVAAGATVLVAAGAGAAFAVAGSSSHRVIESRHLTTGPIRLAYRAPWHPAAQTSLLGSPFAAPAGIIDGTSHLTAGRFKLSALIPGGLPASLRSAYGSPAHATTVSLSGRKVRSYNWSSPGSKVTAFIAGGRNGDVGLICEATTTTGLNGCVTLAKRISLSGAQLIPPGAPAAAVTAVAAAIEPVSVAGRELRSTASKQLVDRATTASRLAAADRRAALRVRRSPMLPRTVSLQRRLAAALGAEADLFSELSKASRENRRAEYISLRPQLAHQSTRVARAVRALKVAGIKVTPPAVLAVPAPPALPKPVVPTSAAPVASAAPAAASETYTPPASSAPAATAAPAAAATSKSAAHASSSSSAPSHTGLPSTVNLGD